MRLYLVDSSIYIYKAWFGGSKTQFNSDNEANQAFVGFTDFVLRLLVERDPQILVFAFDESQKQSQRKAIYTDYKANRTPAPIDLRRQFSWCQQWIEYLGISRASSQQWEADDIIGSLAKLHRSPDLPITILTADKDLLQLIHENDLWWSFSEDKRLDSRAITKKFRVKPEQIAAQLALTGDKVDNIPGIPYIGNKTAASLLRKYETLENLREHLHEVGKMKFRYAGRVQQSLIEHESIIDISSALTKINCDIEDIKTVKINRSPPDVKQLKMMMDIHKFDARRQEKWLRYLQCDENISA